MGHPTNSTSGAGPEITPLSDQEATELIERYESLVFKVAHRLKDNLPDEVELEDLVSWGFMGLLEAYQRYDESKSTQFATFAYYRIRGAILDACPEPLLDPQRRLAEVGCNEVLNTYAHVVQTSQGQVGLEDRLSLLSDVSGSLMMVFVLRDCPARSLRPDGAPHKRDLERRQVAERVRELLEKLSENERKVLVGVYFEGQSLTDIAAELDLSPSWTSRIHARALERLEQIIEEGDEFNDLRHALPV